MAFLELKDVCKSFGGIKALNGVSFTIEKKEILGLIGPNGSGKTTVFNVITGMHRADSGNIIFNNVDITGMPSHRICRAGIARTFQLVRTFNRLTALDNVTAGIAYGSHPVSNLRQARIEAAYILELTGLSVKSDFIAATLGLIDRKRLEIARALATKPQLLLLDEMFAGLNTAEMESAINLVKSIRDSGVTVIVVEHVMKVIMGISDRVVVLKVGEMIADGTPSEISSNQLVRDAYLGNKKAC